MRCLVLIGYVTQIQVLNLCLSLSLGGSMARYQLSPRAARKSFSKSAGLNGRSSGAGASVQYVMRGGIRF